MTDFNNFNGLSILNKLGTVEDFQKESGELFDIVKMDSFFFDSGVVFDGNFYKDGSTTYRKIDVNDYYSDAPTMIETAPLIRQTQIHEVNFGGFKSFSDMKLFSGAKLSRSFDQVALLTLAGVMQHLSANKFNFGNPDDKGTDLSSGGLILCSPATYKKMVQKNWITLKFDENIAPISFLKGVTVSAVNFPIEDALIVLDKEALIYANSTHDRVRMEVDRDIGNVDLLASTHVYTLYAKGFSLATNQNDMLVETPFAESTLYKLAEKDTWRISDEEKVGVKIFTL